jgi:hypothetical protein
MQNKQHNYAPHGTFKSHNQFETSVPHRQQGVQAKFKQDNMKNERFHNAQQSVMTQYPMQIVTDGLMTQENPGLDEHATIKEKQKWKHYP